MRFTANEKTIPRLHLIGTLLLLAVVTLSLAGFYSWRNLRDQAAALTRIEHTITEQQHQRLHIETQAAQGQLDALRQRTEAVLRASAVEQVDAAMQMVQAIYERETARRPQPAPEQVQQLIIEALRPMRFFDGRGYFFVDSMQGRFVLLPTAPQFEGRDGIDNRDDTGAPIMQGLIAAARQPRGQGFHRYRWYRPDAPAIMAEKIAYVRHFAPYDWLIGTGDYIYEWENRQKQEALQRLKALRFGGGGGVGVIDLQGKTLLSPSGAEIEGLYPEQLPPVQRQAMIAQRATAQAGGGLVEYDWPAPAGAAGGAAKGRVQRKTALLTPYAPWGWILVTAMVNDELQSALHAQAAEQAADNTRQHLELALMLLASLLLGLLGSWVFARWSRQLFASYHRQMQRAQEDLRIAAIAFESQEGIFVTDTQAVILRVNSAFTAITGYSAQEAVGQTPRSLIRSGRHDASFYAAMWAGITTQGQWAGEIWNRRKDASVYPQWLTVTAVNDDAGTVTHYVAALTDITQRKAAEEEIRHLAFYDALTGLPNRRLLFDRLQQALLTSRRTQRHAALIFIDLDNFKLVNDSLGHEQGDLLLVAMGERLAGCVREGDTVARLGGDEFVVLLEALSADAPAAAQQAEQIALKMLRALYAPQQLAGQLLRNSASLGVVLISGDAVGAEELFKQADMAMYQAKNAGRNTVRFFDPAMQARVHQRMQLEQELRSALPKEQLRVYYQIQVDALGRPSGAEALLRWQHPQRGMVSPAEFIPLAEDTGLIVPMGQWVLQSACEQLLQWAGEPGREALTLAVNISGRQLHQADFVQQVQDILLRTGAPAERLKLELTESILLDKTEQVIDKMRALCRLGVGFSLDDFGTGYSSLSYLQELPLSQLKIDQKFVRGLGVNERSSAIVRTIVNLAQNLGMQVIAEGVETEQQRDHLAANGCYHYQGYLFGRPVPVTELRV